MTAWTDGRTRPHRYVRRKVTRANLPGSAQAWHGWSDDDPCDTCGGSMLTPDHLLAPDPRHRLPAGEHTVRLAPATGYAGYGEFVNPRRVEIDPPHGAQLTYRIEVA